MKNKVSLINKVTFANQ